MAKHEIHVSNINYDSTAKDLGDAFSAYGTVVNSRIITDRDQFGNQRSAGFGFVEFQTAEAAAAAARADPPLEVAGRTLRVSPARARGERRERKRDTIFVSGIPEGTTEDDLKAVFGKYNPVQIRIVKTDTGERRGFAFIQFDTEDHQTEAHSNNRKFDLKGSESRVQFARSSFGAGRRRGTWRRSGPVRAPRAAPEGGDPPRGPQGQPRRARARGFSRPHRDPPAAPAPHAPPQEDGK